MSCELGEVRGEIPKALKNEHVDHCRTSLQKVRRRAYLAKGHMIYPHT